MLNEEDFRCLVRGGMICINGGMKIALQDIGYPTMYDAIANAQVGFDVGKNHEKEVIVFNG